ncbi:MAG: hypothetical protein E7658_05675 [Ruminococcaceae bacterium]|nr:hypothetical protein [Oscillospiraceae bacterium]
MKKSTKRRVKKSLSIRAAALTILIVMLGAFGGGVYVFREFIFIQHPGEEADSAAYVIPTAQAVRELPNLTCQKHRELPDHTEEPHTITETYGYTLIPRTMSDSITEAEKLLSAYDVPYTVEYALAAYPEGDVLWVEYAGFSDSNGYYVNPAVEVTLCVSGNKPSQTPYNGKNRVYLTFDDGPSAYTPEILDVLDYYGIKAAFFTMGKSIEKYPEIAEEIVERGHILACHTMTHEYEYIYDSVENMISETRLWEGQLEKLGLLDDVAGNLYFRFPGGTVNKYTTPAEREDMIAAVRDRGYRVFDWNVVTNDSLLSIRPEDTDSHTYMREQFFESLALRASAPDKIVLMHDPIRETSEMLPWLIRYLLGNGYCFGTLDQMDHDYLMG